MEKLTEQGRLTEEQEAELAELRSKVAGRKKKDQEVTETGAGGPVADRSAGPKGVLEQAGAEWDGWSVGDVDVDGSVDEVVGDPGGEGRDAVSSSVLGGDGQVFSRVLAERLGTEGSGLSIRAGAGPAGQVGRLGESEAGWGSGRFTSGGLSGWGAAVPVDDTAGGVAGQRGPGEQAAPTEVEIRARIAALQDAVELIEAQEAGLEMVRERDEDGQALRESVKVLRAELAVLQAGLAKFVPAGIARLAEVAGRLERHLRTMPPEFDPNGVREYVETMKQRVHQGRWTPAELQTVESRLGDMLRVEGRLRSARRAKVREVYVQAGQAIAQGRVPRCAWWGEFPAGRASGIRGRVQAPGR
ncbi:hypothetical protein [Saccharopolyspora spinosa]|uniref:hypothetical protein n=1 Tax=Saccharopolyspora spinosa TaxID=60894 RepID=UPI0011D1C375|nr:hypothetical protein [Saccharopolyspora spinosa]